MIALLVPSVDAFSGVGGRVAVLLDDIFSLLVEAVGDNFERSDDDEAEGGAGRG